MATGTDARGQVTRHHHWDTPMWRAKVYDGNEFVAMHFVLDWDEAMNLANSGVRRIAARNASPIDQPALTFRSVPHPTLPGVVVPVPDWDLGVRVGPPPPDGQVPEW